MKQTLFLLLILCFCGLSAAGQPERKINVKPGTDGPYRVSPYVGHNFSKAAPSGLAGRSLKGTYRTPGPGLFVLETGGDLGHLLTIDGSPLYEARERYTKMLLEFTPGVQVFFSTAFAQGGHINYEHALVIPGISNASGFSVQFGVLLMPGRWNESRK